MRMDTCRSRVVADIVRSREDSDLVMDVEIDAENCPWLDGKAQHRFFNQDSRQTIVSCEKSVECVRRLLDDRESSS